MEPTPGPPFEMIETQFFFQLLIPLFHRPSTLPQADRFPATRAGRQVRQSVLDGPVGLLLDQQPDRFGPGAAALPPVVAGPNADPGEAGGQLALGPFPP